MSRRFPHGGKWEAGPTLWRGPTEAQARSKQGLLTAQQQRSAMARKGDGDGLKQQRVPQ